MGILVSIVLPVRDAAMTLGDCLASLAAQSLADHEVVAVDDGSRDASPDVLARAAARDERVRILATGRRGIVAALNLGLASARGSYIARMDADDLAAPRRLELQAAALDRDPAIDILATRVRLFAPGGMSNRGMQRYVAWTNALLRHEEILSQRFVDAPIVHPSVMLRRETVAALGGYREIDGPEDYDLWLRAAERGLRFAKLPQRLLSWRDGASRLTRVDPRYAPTAFRSVKLDALCRGPLSGGRPVVIWGAGPIGKAWARALAARGHAVLAFVDVSPQRLGNRIQGVPVVDAAAACDFCGPLHLAAVGQHGARDRIRALAARAGIEDGRDLLAVA
jgi:glycosyltransferase involved in cell wall biosynthesis